MTPFSILYNHSVSFYDYEPQPSFILQQRKADLPE
jgi:hypothetical protein